MTCHARFLALIMRGGLPWQARTLCQFSGTNWQTNPIYGVSVKQAGGSPPAVSQKLAYLWVMISQFGEGAGG
ncbi:MAG: hypothetical protein SFZ02_11360 [bacterium]|nr:hypothetical protein [bacterium]